MRAVDLLLVLLAVAFIATVAARGAVGAARRRERRALAAARWRPAHYSAAGVTRVVVRRIDGAGRVVDEREVTRIPDDDADYDARFLDAMATARARASVLEVESGA